MVPMEIRKIIVADYEDGMKVKSISRTVRVSISSIYRLLGKKKKKKKKTGTIEPSYENIGRQSEVPAEKLAKMKAMVAENPDITLAEIKESIAPIGARWPKSLIPARTVRAQSTGSHQGAITIPAITMFMLPRRKSQLARRPSNSRAAASATRWLVGRMGHVPTP